MKIQLQSTLLELTGAIREYAEKRFAVLAKPLTRFEREGECVLEVEIARTTRHHRKGEVYYVELTLPLKNKILRIEQYSEDLRAGIDAAKKRMQMEIEKHKEKMVDSKRKSKL
jgi:putative sigma-54 modulation protein